MILGQNKVKSFIMDLSNISTFKKYVVYKKKKKILEKRTKFIKNRSDEKKCTQII